LTTNIKDLLYMILLHFSGSQSKRMWNVLNIRQIANQSADTKKCIRGWTRPSI